MWLGLEHTLYFQFSIDRTTKNSTHPKSMIWSARISKSLPVFASDALFQLVHCIKSWHVELSDTVFKFLMTTQLRREWKSSRSRSKSGTEWVVNIRFNSSFDGSGNFSSSSNSTSKYGILYWKIIKPNLKLIRVTDGDELTSVNFDLFFHIWYRNNVFISCDCGSIGVFWSFSDIPIKLRIDSDIIKIFMRMRNAVAESTQYRKNGKNISHLSKLLKFLLLTN